MDFDPPMFLLFIFFFTFPLSLPCRKASFLIPMPLASLIHPTQYFQIKLPQGWPACLNSLFQSFNSSPWSTKLSPSQFSNTEGPFFNDFGFYYSCNLSHHTSSHTCHLQPNWTSSFSRNSLRPIYACLHLGIWPLRSSTHVNSFMSFSQSFQPEVMAMCLCLEQCPADKKYLFNEWMTLSFLYFHNILVVVQ